jgi:tetratricopeptide (TPR) repeat protein
MGKTQTAAEFVHRNKSGFDVILWVHADEVSKLAHDFKSIAVQMGLVGADSPDSKNQSVTRDIVKQWLVNPVKKFRDSEDDDAERATWLLIYDGADDPAVLDEFWPRGGIGSILVTTRNAVTWGTMRKLQPFSIEEAIDYLLKMTNHEANPEQRTYAVDVARRLGGFPLALSQMTGIMNQRRLTFSQFLAAYNLRESQEMLLNTHLEGGLQHLSYKHNLATVWGLENLRYGRALLDVMSMLDPDSIAEDILTSMLGQITLPGYPHDSRTYEQAKMELLTCSLIAGERTMKRLSLHRLVQDVAIMQMSPAQLQETFLTTVRIISHLWPYLPFTWRHDVARWSQCEKYFSHIVRLKELTKQISMDGSDVDGQYELARLLTDAGWYHHERGQSILSLEFYDLAQEVCDSIKDIVKAIDRGNRSNSEGLTIRKLDLILVELQHNRGCVAVETSAPKDALKYHKRFNEMMLSEISEGPMVEYDMRLAMSWNEVGNAYAINNKWQKAEECFKISISTMRKLQDYQEVLISLPLANLGLIYWLTNRNNDAELLLLDGLRSREKVYGTDDRESFM